MDDIRAGYRDAEQETDEAIRGQDGRTPADEGGNIGDRLGHDLGNLGEHPGDVGGSTDTTFPKAPVGEHSM